MQILNIITLLSKLIDKADQLTTSLKDYADFVAEFSWTSNSVTNSMELARGHLKKLTASCTKGRIDTTSLGALMDIHICR